MKWIKQSFIFALKNPRASLVLAILGLATLYVSALLHFAGVVLASFIFVFIQSVVFNYFSKKPLFQIKNKSSLLLTGVLSVPTNIMMGSVVGLLQGADTVAMTLAVVVVFSIFCALSYIVLGHIVGFISLQDLHFEKALNAALKGFAQHRLNLLMLSCLSAILLMLSALPFGLGLILSLPMHFYLYYFSYNDLYQQKSNEIDA